MKFVMRIVLSLVIFTAGAVITLAGVLGGVSDAAVIIGAALAVLVGVLGPDWFVTRVRRRRNISRLRHQQRQHIKNRQARTQRKLVREEGFESRIVNGEFTNLGR